MLGSWAAVLGQLIPLALVVALSPLTIIPAIVLVLQSDRARATGLAFLSGWLLRLAAPRPAWSGSARRRQLAPAVRCLEWVAPPPRHQTAGMPDPGEQDDPRRRS